MLWSTPSELRILISPGLITSTFGWNSHPFWSSTAGADAFAPLASDTETRVLASPPFAPTVTSLIFFSCPQTSLSLLTLTTLGAGAAPVNFTSPLIDPPPWAPTGSPDPTITPTAAAATATTLRTIDCFIDVLPPCSRITALGSLSPPLGPSRQPDPGGAGHERHNWRHHELPLRGRRLEPRIIPGRHGGLRAIVTLRAVPRPERYRKELPGTEDEVRGVTGLQRPPDHGPVLASVVDALSLGLDRLARLGRHLADAAGRRLPDVAARPPGEQIHGVAPVAHEEVRAVSRPLTSRELDGDHVRLRRPFRRVGRRGV